MFLEGTLLEKLRKIEALHAGTTVDGEKEDLQRDRAAPQFECLDGGVPNLEILILEGGRDERKAPRRDLESWHASNEPQQRRALGAGACAPFRRLTDPLGDLSNHPRGAPPVAFLEYDR